MQADRLPAESLSSHRVFRQIPPEELDALSARVDRLTCPAGSLVVAAGQPLDHLYLITHGAIELSDADANWSLQIDRDECFGAGIAPRHLPFAWDARARIDSSLLIIRADDLVEMAIRHPWLGQFFPHFAPVTGSGDAGLPADAVGPVPRPPDGTFSLLATPVGTLVRRPAVTVSPAMSVRVAAGLMSEQRVSSVLLVDAQALAGLVTDRDLRNRVLAPGIDSERPVSEIATLTPITIDSRAPAFEALLLMVRRNIHHLPVMDGQRIVGMITTTDLTEQQSTSAVYLVGDIHKQTSVPALALVSRRIKVLQQHLAAADASAYATGHIVTTITDALTTRLIQLAQAQFGPPPVDFVWVAAGSQARNEQTAMSDQDNCLVISDEFIDAEHGDYFRSLARFVCDGLDACGYMYCPGGMMAMTDTWCQPWRNWVSYFDHWLGKPDPKALLLTCVFFDMRAVYGRGDLLDTLRRHVLKRTRGNTLFLAHMVGNALQHRPPVGLFGNITTIRGGDHAGTIDLKLSGTVPIVDLARVFALAGGVDAVNTSDRLERAAVSGEINNQSSRDLKDALEFLTRLRIAHQARQTASDRAPDNFLSLDELSSFERSHLKQAFTLVNGLQGMLGQRFQVGRH